VVITEHFFCDHGDDGGGCWSLVDERFGITYDENNTTQSSLIMTRDKSLDTVDERYPFCSMILL
jgi:hypothetical protein